jgi:hypothetical protein
MAPVGQWGTLVEHQEYCRRSAVIATRDRNAGVVGDDEFSIAARGNLFHDRSRQTLHLMGLPSYGEHEHTATPHVHQHRQTLVELRRVSGWLLFEWEETDVDPERQSNGPNAEVDHVRTGGSRQIRRPLYRCQRVPRRVAPHGIAPANTPYITPYIITHSEPGRTHLDHTSRPNVSSAVRHSIDRDRRSTGQLHDADRSAVLELHQQMVRFDLRVGDHHVARFSTAHDVPTGRQTDDSAGVWPGVDANTDLADTGRGRQSTGCVKLAVHEWVSTRHRLTAARRVTHRRKEPRYQGR